jgi:uncharacterized 2Fe-2S/4Fe-4S cluster protein (DUF4445 family)
LSKSREKTPSKSLVKVSFPDEGEIITIPKGSTVLDAAISAGVFINSVCGGVGRCGKCKIVATGEIKKEKTELVTKEEQKSGISLACNTTVLGDSEVHIPEASKLDIHQILTKCEMVEISEPKPFINKYFLKMDEPTLDNNQSDFTRVKQSLIKHIDNSKILIDNISAPVSILRELPWTLRNNDWELTITAAVFEKSIEIIRLEPGDTSKSLYGVCVDIGTTTIVVELIDLISGNRLSCLSNYNKQKICGEDVLSRIMYAEEHGVGKLQELVIENINYLITELTKKTNNQLRDFDKNEICYIVLAGNTTMTHMLLGLDPSTIRRDPYIPTVNVLPFLKAKELGLYINPEGLVYCLPCRSSWVGGDITADILASNLHHQDELSLMIDVGTNGEVVLGNKDWMVGCSCSAGPAFEGGEVQFGMNASLGAIEKLQFTDDCDVRFKTIGNARPKGICGSGLIDALSELFTHKVIDKNGQFKSINKPRLKEVDGEPVFVLVEAKETGFEHKKDIYITETDIKNILRTKAAIYAACNLLLKSVGYSFNDLANIYIAGGFGNYLDTKKSILLGLLPDVPLEKFKFIGNGSLAGSYLTLISDDKRKEAEDVYEKLTYIELSVSNEFYNEFVSALFLPHTNLSLFPSLKEILEDFEECEA